MTIVNYSALHMTVCFMHNYMYVCVHVSEVPSAPIGLRVNEVTSSSLQVSWSAPASDGGTNYIVPVGVR